MDQRKKVVVAMSGGVDSTVAAHLLIEAGYEVSGLYMQVYDTVSDEAEKDFILVCEHLGIPHEVVDLSEVFKQHVVDYFIEAYEKGLTPNPCVACNKYIKFGVLLDMAKERGADYLATGHYAKIIENDGVYFIERARHDSKDQTYMFYNMNQDILKYLLMPLGQIESKEKVREIAVSIDAPVAHKGESQEICFVPNDDYIAFLKDEGVVGKKGKFVDKKGNVVGEHKGAVNFTIGQRKGLGMSFGKPTYVLNIDEEKRHVVLGDNEDLMVNELIATEFNWVSLPIDESQEYQAKIRYSAIPSPCRIAFLDEKTIKVTFEKKQRAITPGQSIVFYQNTRLIGGAIIKK
jgi:tRNA-specific 2-thiouridylase